MPAHCVWDDNEFSQNELQLESKTALRHLVEQYMPSTKNFFTQILRLQDADTHELLADLILMQTEKCNDPKRVYRIYERICTHRRSCGIIIRHVLELMSMNFRLHV
jgi:hypothetical protein